MSNVASTLLLVWTGLKVALSLRRYIAVDGISPQCRRYLTVVKHGGRREAFAPGGILQGSGNSEQYTSVVSCHVIASCIQGRRRVLLAGRDSGIEGPRGVQGQSSTRGHGDKVPQKLTMFCQLALLGWTLVNVLKHLRFILPCAEGVSPYQKFLIGFMKISSLTCGGWGVRIPDPLASYVPGCIPVSFRYNGYWTIIAYGWQHER